jgi:hypothetical protein
MGNGIRVKHKHIWYNPNKKKTVSGKKYEKAIAHYKKLLKRIEIEGETKWLKNALEMVKAKFKKYGITEDMIK